MKETGNPDLAPLLPASLQPGDTIGLFCPAGPVRDIDRINAGVRVLQDMGFRVRIQGGLSRQTDSSIYLAAADSTRAGQLHDLWEDEEIKAVMAVRGGYGCLRLLGRLDFSRFRATPKWLIGFSDLTVLLASNFIESGLIGLHGPVVSSLAGTDRASKERLFSLLTGSYQPYFLENKTHVLRSGIGSGRIVVGNLTTFSHLIGTPWEPDFAGAVLLLEDTGESMYRVDRMFTQLRLSGRLNTLAGLVLGTFDTGDSAVGDNQLQDSLFERVLELTAHTGYPIWANFPFGHLSENLAIPYGMVATMASSPCKLSLYPDSEQL